MRQDLQDLQDYFSMNGGQMFFHPVRLVNPVTKEKRTTIAGRPFISNLKFEI
jgi:hypothetical protein